MSEKMLVAYQAALAVWQNQDGAAQAAVVVGPEGEAVQHSPFRSFRAGRNGRVRVTDELGTRTHVGLSLARRRFLCGGKFPEWPEAEAARKAVKSV